MLVHRLEHQARQTRRPFQEARLRQGRGAQGQARQQGARGKSSVALELRSAAARLPHIRARGAANAHPGVRSAFWRRTHAPAAWRAARHALEGAAKRGLRFVAHAACDGRETVAAVANPIGGELHAPAGDIFDRRLAHDRVEPLGKNGAR